MKILLITGASGVGKSSIAYEICKDDKYHLVKSYTDRPKRQDDLDHICVSSTDIGYFSIKDIAAFTNIDGYTYCTLFDSFIENKMNVYVVDKPGLDQMIRAFPDACIISVLITRKNIYIDDKRKKRHILIPSEKDVTFSIPNDTTIENAANIIKEVLHHITESRG